MKLLLFSDNHRDKESVKSIIKQNPGLEHYISLGDSEMREYELTELGIYGVKGNNPFDPNFPLKLTLAFDGLKVFLTHGHLYSVKMGLSKLLNYGSYNDIDIICFGHTHQYLIKDINGILFINPGSLSTRRIFSKSSYALLEITEKEINVRILTVKGETILEYTKSRGKNGDKV